jgi:methylmalonyl-CoA/ethylmalonyl-CoA epimerase
MNLSQIGQIALAVSNTDRAEAFYEQILGLRKLYRYGDLAFFDCAGTRLMLSPPEENGGPLVAQGAIYFRVADLLQAEAQLKSKGVALESAAHRIAQMPDHDLWMAFIRDPDGHLIGLMMEAPKGYQPPAT